MDPRVLDATLPPVITSLVLLPVHPLLQLILAVFGFVWGIGAISDRVGACSRGAGDAREDRQAVPSGS